MMRSRIRSLPEHIQRVFGSLGIFWIVAALALLCSLLLVLQKLQPSDDAYITFRHVRNLLEHGKPAWNLSGDPVLGSTTPGFMLALAAFCAVFGLDQIDQAALYLNACFHFVIVILAFLVAKNTFSGLLPSLLFALLIGLNAINVHVFSVGFESAMFLVVLLGSLYFVRVERDCLSLFLASLAPLIRPEGVLLTPLVWGYVLRQGRFKKVLLLAYVPVPLLWLVCSTAYYGSPVPHAIQAKQKFPLIYRPYNGEEVDLLSRMPDLLSHAANLWDHQAGSVLLGGSTSRDFETPLQKVRRWIMLMGLPLSLVSCLRRPDGRIIYLLYAPLFLLLFGLIGHTQQWYFPSFVTLSILVLFSGWVRVHDYAVAKLATRADSRALRWKAPQAFLIVMFLVFVTVNNYKINRGQYDHRHRGAVFPVNAWGSMWDLREIQRATYYREAAEYVGARAAPSDVVLISEVGVFGYEYPGKVLDAVGLCSPESLKFYPPPEWDIRDSEGNYYNKGNNLTPTNMVMTLRPEFVVNSRYYTANLLRDGSPFLDEYEEIHRFGRIWGEPVIIHTRRGTQELHNPHDDESSDVPDRD